MKETLPQAIALCRVSTKGQLLDGNLEPQEERIIRAAAVLNVKIVQWWKLAVSSRKGKNLQRKDILEMYDYCKANHRVKYLIADEVDRFMRSISEYYYWKVMFQNVGVELRHANRPDADPAEDRAVFDELIDVYRAESSNNERITKTPEKMMAKIRLGYYPSNPHSGYKKSDVPGLHVPDEPNWSALINLGIGTANAESHMVTAISGSGPYTLSLATALTNSWSTGSVLVTKPIASGTTTPAATSITVASSGTWAGNGVGNGTSLTVDAYQFYTDTSSQPVVGGSVGEWFGTGNPPGGASNQNTVWYGIATSTSSETLEIDWGYSSSPACIILEFTPTGTPAFSAYGRLDNQAASTTLDYPTLTALSSGLYVGGCGGSSGTSFTGGTSGFTFQSNGGQTAFSWAWNPDTSSGSLSPSVTVTPDAAHSTIGAVFSGGPFTLAANSNLLWQSGGLLSRSLSYAPQAVGNLVVLLFVGGGQDNWPTPTQQGCTFSVNPGNPRGGASQLFNPTTQGYTNTTLPLYSFPAWMGTAQERTYYTDNNNSGGGASSATVTDIKSVYDADPCFTGAWIDSARPRKPWISSVYQGSTAVAWGTTAQNMVAAGLTGWMYEVPCNEPENGLTGWNSGSTLANSVSAAISAIQAQDSTAKYAVYCSAGVPESSSYSQFTSFLSQFGDTYNYVSMHDESSTDNLPEMVLLRSKATTIAGIISASPNPSAITWRTETGISASYTAVYHPRRQAAQTTKFLLVQELYLGPKEYVYTYSSWVGNGGYPTSGYVELPNTSNPLMGTTTSSGGSMRLGGYAAHVMSEALYGTTPSPDLLSFGTVGGVADQCFVGAHYTSSAGDVIVLATNGIGYSAGETVTLNCSSLTDVVVWNGVGQAITSQCTIAGNNITVPVDDLLTYVFLPRSVTVFVVSTGSGLLAVSAAPIANVIAGANSIAAESVADVLQGSLASMSLANTGELGTNLYIDLPNSTDVSSSNPATVTATFDIPLNVTGLLVKSTQAWNASAYSHAAPISFTISINGTVVYTYNNPTAITLSVPTSANSDTCPVTTFWDHNYTFIVPVEAKGVKSIELSLTQSSQGGEPDLIASPYYGDSGTTRQRLFLADFLAFQTPISGPPSFTKPKLPMGMSGV